MLHINDMRKISNDELCRLVKQLGEAQQYELETMHVTTGKDCVQLSCVSGEILAIKAGSDEIMEVDPDDGTIWKYDAVKRKTVIAVDPYEAKDIRIHHNILYADGQFFAIVRTESVNLDKILESL